MNQALTENKSDTALPGVTWGFMSQLSPDVLAGMRAAQERYEAVAADERARYQSQLGNLANAVRAFLANYDEFGTCTDGKYMDAIFDATGAFGD